MTLTIVTAIYDIRNDETILKHYFELGQIWAQIDQNMIIFTEEKLVAPLMELRAKYIEQTRIITQPFSETDFYRFRGQLIENMRNFQITNINHAKDTPDYIILNNNKFYWLRRAISANYFESSHYMWLDFGIGHVATLNRLHKIFKKIPNHIRQMKISSLPSHINYKDYFTSIRHNLAGGLFSGHVKYITYYIELFYEHWSNVIEENWYQLDEAIMTIINHKYPNLFKVYYGDYNSLIDNYHQCYSLDTCIIDSLEINLQHRNYKEISHILNYLETNFESQKWCYDFLYYAIIGQYYYNERKLSPKVFKFIMDSLKASDKKMANFVLQNYSNLKFYLDIQDIWLKIERIYCDNEKLRLYLPADKLTAQLEEKILLVITSRFDVLNFGFLIQKLYELSNLNRRIIPLTENEEAYIINKQ